MKHVIPFLLLAFAVAACTDEGPIVPASDPAFAKGGQPGPPDKPPPEPPAGLYTLVELQQPCRRCEGIAHDVSEPAGDVLYVVGTMDINNLKYGVIWAGTRADLGEQPPMQLPGSYDASGVQGISDDHDLVVGAAERSGEAQIPVVWEANGNDWLDAVPLGVGGYQWGTARDVNNGGMIAGRLRSASGEAAAVWHWPATDAVTLETPAGYLSWASGLNNDGDVVGSIWDADTHKAALWTWTGGAHHYCDLSAGQPGETRTWRVDDRDASGQVLVAGQIGIQPAIWVVNITTCEYASPTIINVAEGRVLDVVRYEDGSWDAVGDELQGAYRPQIWYDEMTGEALDKSGFALVINGVGDIAGSRVKAGLLQAVLWVRTASQ